MFECFRVDVFFSALSDRFIIMKFSNAICFCRLAQHNGYQVKRQMTFEQQKQTYLAHPICYRLLFDSIEYYSHHDLIKSTH